MMTSVLFNTCSVILLMLNGLDAVSPSIAVTRLQLAGRFSSRCASPPTILGMAGFEIEEDEGEIVEPGKMRLSEIKAELDLRGIDYLDCFDKEAMALRLEDARASGKADPNILKNFQQQKLEYKMTDEDLSNAIANDGTLPGGLKPEQFQKLTSNPEIMQLLQSPKIQEAMILIMSGDGDDLEAKLKDDLELRETIEKLNVILGSMQ